MIIKNATNPSFLRRITTPIACFGLGISALMILMRIVGMVVDHDYKIFNFLFILIIISIPCSIIAIYLIIKEEKYWTNDPSVMSPLRKFAKKMILPNIILLMILLFSQAGAGLIISGLLSAIFFLGMWKSKFSKNPFHYSNSSYASSSSNIMTNPSYSSVSGNIYNR